MDEAIAAMRTIPGFGDAFGQDAGVPPAVRLGGLTNRVYRVEADGVPLVLRIPGEGTEAYIDRAVEAVNARAAAAAGVSPEVLHVDPERGLMLTRHVAGRTMTPAAFREPGTAARAAEALARLHASGAEFAFRFELFAMIEEYLRVLAGRDVALPEGYHAAVAEAEAVRAALEARPAALAPCHCDPLCENFLDTGTRMWIVDWEYSGMNDPLWDLGDLAVEGEFGPAQEEEMLSAYFGRPASAAERGRVVAYKAMCDLLWTLWGLIQHADRNPADDFWAYATNRFARCRRLMAQDDFARHLAAVRAG